MIYLELIGGLIYLLLAGDLLVRGSVALAQRARVAPMVVGLTVVAFGTSAPELFVSVGAAVMGAPGLALGNVVGSNIANVLVVLGLPAIVYPTVCERKAVCAELVLVLGVSVLFTALCFLGPLGFVEGLGMLLLMLLLLVRTLRRGRNTALAPVGEEPELERVLGLPTRRRMIGLFLGLGLLGLPLGANLIVHAAVRIAAAAGVSNAVIGLSVVALGTSLPELGTTLIAAFHRQSDVALGNVLGSNLFNLLAIMGVTAMVAPGPIPVPSSFLHFDLLVMLAATALLGWFAWVGRIGRVAGATLVAGYALYVLAVFSLPVGAAAAFLP